MWLSSWLRKRTISARQRPANRIRPQLEVLEDRAVPATLTVNTTVDVLGHANGMLSLRQAVLDSNASATADTIIVPAGTYNLTLAGVGDTGTSGDLEVNPAVTKALTISGAGAATTIIDGGGNDRIFEIGYGTVSITGFTMQHGNPGLANGGAIWSRNATLSVSNCTLSGNTAQSGGAIASGHPLSVSNCTFSGNTTDNPHGGYGGAIDAYSGTLAVSDCIFYDNENYGFGGAIYSSGAATISSSSFSGNSAIRGGAILNAGGAMTVSNCTLSGNSASESGGGILNSGKLVIRASTVSDNTAPVSPDLAGTASIFNSTIGDTYFP